MGHCPYCGTPTYLLAADERDRKGTADEQFVNGLRPVNLKHRGCEFCKPSPGDPPFSTVKAMTKYQLVKSLFARAADRVLVPLPDGRRGLLQSIEREDGGGNNFNLTVLDPASNRPITYFVRTTD